MKKANWLTLFLVSIGIGIILELVVFNFRTIESFAYQPTNLTNKIKLHGMKETEGKIEITNNNDNYIEITSINKKINNIKLDLEIDSFHDYLKYTIYGQDEANHLYFSLPTQYLYPKITRSKYVRLHLSGKSEKIKIIFNDYKNQYAYQNGYNQQPFTFHINKISINEKVPIDISFTRLFLVIAGIIILYSIRPKSSLWKIKMEEKNKKQKLVVATVMTILSLLFFYIINITPQLKNPIDSNQHQYQELTKALANGQLNLDIEVDEKLKEMKNPYDSGYRNELREKKGLTYEWDKAYYKGKYYVYFGIVPVITTYLPFYLLTNHQLPNYLVVLGISILVMIGIFLLLKEIIKQYFPKTSFLLFLILFVWLTITGGLMPILTYPSIYTIPPLYALMFTYFGLYFFLSAEKEGKIRTHRIGLGALSMALVAGCRPQLLLGSCLLIPMYWNKIWKERKLFSKKSIKETLALIIPYFIVAILLMTYNKVRFGSIFDFGANYNLTGNDMTRRGFILDRIGLGIFYLLFHFPTIKATFPFIMTENISTNYMGVTIYEPVYGGLLIVNGLLWLGICFFKFKKLYPKKELFYLCLTSIISALIILIMDVEMAGILYRYFADFSFLLTIPTVIVVLTLQNSNQVEKQTKQVILTLMLIFIIGSIGYQFLTIFQDYYFRDFINCNPPFYFKWNYLLQWWL